MKSGKQRRAENKSKHRRRKQQPGASAKVSTGSEPSGERIPVNESLLAPNNSYGVPDFVTRGYYVDRPFRCVGCGKQEVWTATQQKWWYEVAKGFVYSTAVRCRACRHKERARREEARRIHRAGLSRKRSASGEFA